MFIDIVLSRFIHDTGEDPKQHVFGYNAGNNVKKEKNEHLRAKG